jgi:hypothetical protein
MAESVLSTVGRRVLEAAERATGRTVVESDHLDRVEEAARETPILRRELEYVGWTILNHVGGQSHELKPEARRTLALKSLNAFLSDPQAGAIVERYVSFVLGRGVPKPQARDAEVQTKIDEAWADRANKRILTSQQALVEKARDYMIQDNVFFLFFDEGMDGKVRMSLLRFDTVEDAVRHEDDRFRILWYYTLEKPQKWNPQKRAYEPVDPNGRPKATYYEAVEAFDEEALDEVAADEGMWTPSEGEMGRGKVLHLAGNKTSEMAFGVPRLKRLLRWFTAYNEILESHADRMKAAARLYMKQTVHGGKSQVERAGLMAVRRSSPLSAPQSIDGEPTGPPEGLANVVRNQGMDFEPFKIDSGAADIAASGPVFQGQVAAGGNFPRHYIGGDPGSLAGATSVELPVLKFIELEQELWATPFRKLADLTIARAVETGNLDEWRDPTEEEMQRIADGEEIETDSRGRVRRDLSYEFALPSPLQRQMLDLVNAAVTTASAVDPNGDFPELSRWLFGFILAEAFDVQDPQRIVDEVMPRARVQQLEAERRAAVTAANAGGAEGADGDRHDEDNPYGARRESRPPEEVREAASRRDRLQRRARPRRRAAEEDFDEIVVGPARTQARALAGVGESDGPG